MSECDCPYVYDDLTCLRVDFDLTVQTFKQQYVPQQIRRKMERVNRLDPDALCTSHRYDYNRIQTEYSQYLDGTLMISCYDGKKLMKINVNQYYLTVYNPSC